MYTENALNAACHRVSTHVSCHHYQHHYHHHPRHHRHFSYLISHLFPILFSPLSTLQQQLFSFLHMCQIVSHLRTIVCASLCLEYVSGHPSPHTTVWITHFDLVSDATSSRKPFHTSSYLSRACSPGSQSILIFSYPAISYQVLNCMFTSHCPLLNSKLFAMAMCYTNSLFPLN